VDAGRPISHVAAEAGISRRCLATWYGRWLADGEDGLHDRSSRPAVSPNRTNDDVADLVEALRRQTKHGPARLVSDLQRLHGITLAPATVHRILVRRGLSRLRDLDAPTGAELRQVVRYEHHAVGDLVHVDVKKLGRIPDGGGWRMHGRGSDAARVSKRTGQGTGRVGYLYLHTALDDYSRLAYTEALDDERGTTAAGFWLRSAAFFAEHGVHSIRRVLTDNGSCYRSRAWAVALATTSTKHKRTRPYTPRTNGKVERFNGTWPASGRTSATTPARPNGSRRWPTSSTSTTTSDRTPHWAASRRSPAPPGAASVSPPADRPNRSISALSSSRSTSCNQRPGTPHLGRCQ
jgi:transposase InsO family protein